MKLKFGMVVTSGRGKLGGHIVSDNASGTFASTARASPYSKHVVNGPTRPAHRQAAVHAYSQLTQLQQQQWLIETNNYIRTNALGNHYKMTAQQLFVSANINLQIAQQAILVVPAPKVVPASTPDFAITAAQIGPQLRVDYLIGLPNSGNAIVYRASPCVSNGRSRIGSQMRQIFQTFDAGQTFDILTTHWQAVFGTQMYAGQRVFVEVYTIHIACGCASSRVLENTVVA